SDQDRHHDQKVQTRAAPHASLGGAELNGLPHDPLLLRTDGALQTSAARSEARKIFGGISRPLTIRARPIRSNSTHCTCPPTDFLSPANALSSRLTSRSSARGKRPANRTVTRNNSNSELGSKPSRFEISAAAIMPRPTASPCRKRR